MMALKILTDEPCVICQHPPHKDRDGSTYLWRYATDLDDVCSTRCHLMATKRIIRPVRLAKIGLRQARKIFAPSEQMDYNRIVHRESTKAASRQLSSYCPDMRHSVTTLVRLQFTMTEGRDGLNDFRSIY